MKKAEKDFKIENRKNRFKYTLEKEYIAGISLVGSEVKSISSRKCDLSEAYIYIVNGEAYIKNFYINEYTQSSYLNHDVLRDKKLLLNKSEINNIFKMISVSGMTAYPVELIKLNNKFKLKIGIGKGKKLYDKRQTIKERDITRNNNRNTLN